MGALKVGALEVWAKSFTPQAEAGSGGSLEIVRPCAEGGTRGESRAPPFLPIRGYFLISPLV